MICRELSLLRIGFRSVPVPRSVPADPAYSIPILNAQSDIFIFPPSDITIGIAQ